MPTLLKPCPFCGGDAKLDSDRLEEDVMAAWVECTRCEVSTCRFEDTYAPNGQAIDAWNRRATTNT